MRSAAARLRSLISANDLLKGKLAMDIPDNGPGEILWSSIAKFELDLDKIKRSSCGPVKVQSRLLPLTTCVETTESSRCLRPAEDSLVSPEGTEESRGRQP